MNQDPWKSKEQQRTLAPLSVPGASSAGSIRVVSGSGFRYVVPFPYRLHEMLSSVDEKHDSSIVSWLPDGKHFKVHDPRRFVEVVIPSAFKQKSLKSFQRQLHLYGFQRVHEGVDKGAYYHEKFRRDDRDLCLSITRTKAPKRSRATPAMQKYKTFAPKAAPKDNSAITNAAAVSPTGFDQASPNARFVPLDKVPLHKAVSMDESGVQSHTPDQQSSSQNQTFPQQQLNAIQQLDGSIVETCRWLINAGVPMSAFDPVAISDISHSTFAVPQLVSSNPPLNNGIQQQSTIIENGPETNINLNNNNNNAATDPLHFHANEMKNVGAMDPLPLTTQSSHSLESLSNIFQDTIPNIEDDPLLTALFPGEQLPMVDDSLWAL